MNTLSNVATYFDRDSARKHAHSQERMKLIFSDYNKRL